MSNEVMKRLESRRDKLRTELLSIEAAMSVVSSLGESMPEETTQSKRDNFDRISDYFKENGNTPATKQQIAAHIGITVDAVDWVVNRGAKSYKFVQKGLEYKLRRA